MRSLTASPNEISAVNSKMYSERFVTFVQKGISTRVLTLKGIEKVLVHTTMHQSLVHQKRHMLTLDKDEFTGMFIVAIIVFVI